LDRQTPQGGALYIYLRNSKKKNISGRPIIVDQKQRIGDLAIDLIRGKDHKGAILTTTERKICFELMVLLPNKSSQTIKKGTNKPYGTLQR
jgi:IS30 family transposase